MSSYEKHAKSMPRTGVPSQTTNASHIPPASRAKSGYGAWALIGAFCLGAGTTVAFSNAISTEPGVSLTPVSTTPTATKPAFKQPSTFNELLAISSADLGKVDLALMNLLCAEGLPGSENLNVAQCLATLDEWAEKIRDYTERHHVEYLRDPAETHTWAEYRMMIIMSALSKGLGVHYDVESAIAEYGVDPATTKGAVTDFYPRDKLGAEFFTKSDLYFINGLLGPKRTGTCASLPVLVAAIAQRLGYPVKLVNTFRHSFVRWDDGKERFNIETTVVGGLQTMTDDEYRKWPRPLTAKMIETEKYLQPLTPSDALACFVYSRIGCLMANGQVDQAVKLLPKCSVLVPSSVKYTRLPAL